MNNSLSAVSTENLSRAWLETTRLVGRAAGRKLFHTVTAITNPQPEDPDIRRACDKLLVARNLPTVETVANTIFPRAIALHTSSPEELTTRYRASYSVIRRFKGNQKGTYFGRLVAYPGPNGEVDQLVRVVDHLRRESQGSGPMGARYELSVNESADNDTAPEAATSIGVRAAHRDTSPRGFPCLSMLSFNLDGDKVHLLAHYRYEFLISKGYGNYLGLARLLAYVSAEAGLAVGRMTVVTGRAHVDAPKGALEYHLGHLP